MEISSPNAVRLRPIDPGDNETLARIIRDSLTEFNAAKPGTVFYDESTDHLYELFRQQGSAYYVAVRNEEILGGAGLYPTPGLPEGIVELVKMYLVPHARGLGIGRQLMSRNMKSAIELGYKQLYIETMPELKDAIRSYEKTGFSYLERSLTGDNHPGCGIWMIRDL